MKTRIITGVVAGAAMLVVLFLPWTIVLTVGTSIICGISVYEVLAATKMIGHRGQKVLAIAFALIAPFFDRMTVMEVVTICIVYVLAVILLYLRYHDALPLEKVGGVFLLSVMIAVSLSSLSYLRNAGAHGLFYVFLALIISWMSDIGAYFIGTFFGKHKLCPNISPKKTVEGLVGGIGFSILMSLFAGVIYQAVFLQGAAVSYWTIFGLALIGAPLSVIGDLFASLIKRRCGIKDFGNLFPGHGGMMDRFDSLLFVLPIVYFAVRFLPIIY